MNRIKRIALQLLEKYPTLFTTQYEDNKEALDKVAEFRSKELRNMIAGYITSYMKKNSKREVSTSPEV